MPAWAAPADTAGTDRRDPADVTPGTPTAKRRRVRDAGPDPSP